MMRAVLNKASGAKTVFWAGLQKRAEEMKEALMSKSAKVKHSIQERSSEMKESAGMKAEEMREKTTRIEKQIHKNPVFRATSIYGAAALLCTATVSGMTWLISLIREKTDDEPSRPLTVAESKILLERLSTVEGGQENMASRLLTLELEKQQQSSKKCNCMEQQAETASPEKATASSSTKAL